MHLIHSHCCATITTLHFKNFFCHLKRKLCTQFPLPLAFGNHWFTFCLCEFDMVLGTSYKSIHIVFVLLCLAYFDIMTSWFIPIVAYVRISFLFKTEYYSVLMYIPHLVYPFIGQWTFELMPSFDLLCYCYSIFWLIVLWTQIYKNLFKSLLSVLLGVYPEVELLDQIVALYLVFWENNRLLSYILYPVTLNIYLSLWKLFLFKECRGFSMYSHLC